MKSHSERMTKSDSNAPDYFELVYEFVRAIPVGKVVTYGQIAECIIEMRLTARQVGSAMRFSPPDIPWQRVVGAGGFLPIAKRSPHLHQTQLELLRQEGASFCIADTNRLDMELAQWNPGDMEAF